MSKLTSVGDPVVSVLSAAVVSHGRSFLDSLNKDESAGPKSLAGIVKIAKEQGSHLALVIDEVNLALPGEGENPHADPRYPLVKKFLAMLVSSTKEKNEASALLVTSEHGYPFRLKALGFNTGDIEKTIVAGEVPPGEMRQLLREKWRLGPAVTDLLMAHYGGHIMLCKNALVSLHELKGSFQPFGLGLLKAINAGVRKTSRLSDDNMVDTLRRLQRDGYAIIPEMEVPYAKAISLNNVGGVAFVAPDVIGLHPDVLKEHADECAIFSTCHTARLIIDMVLKSDIE